MAATLDSLTSGGELDVGDYLSQWLAHVAGRVRPKTLVVLGSPRGPRQIDRP